MTASSAHVATAMAPEASELAAFHARHPGGAVDDRWKWRILLAIEIALILVAWEVAVSVLELVRPQFMPPPSSIAASFGELLARPSFPGHVAYSVTNLVIGVALAAVFGISIGLLVGWSRLMELMVAPVLWTVYSVPKVAFAPLVILALGLGPPSKIFLVFLLGFFPIALNAAGTVPAEIPAMATMGIAAFKVFMVIDTGRDYPHMPGIGVHDHGKLLEIFETVGPTGVRLMVHPHDQALMDHIERQYWDRGERDFRAYAKAYAAHDGIIWDTAAALLLRLQLATGTPLHLLHTQTRGVVAQLRAAKARGQDVSAELNPWAVFLGNDWANVERLGSYALSYYVPEINTEPLWEALADGTIDLISTDHAPHTREEKEPGWTDGWKAHTGTPSAQFYVPMFLDAAGAGRLPLERVVELTSTAPARIFGLADKGRLEVGADADIAIVDLELPFEIRDEDVLSKIGWTPYAGRTGRGTVTTTLVRGRTVYEDGRVTGRPGWGRQAVPDPMSIQARGER